MAAAPPAHAAFPGTNGKIAFTTMRDEPDPDGCQSRGACNSEIYAVNADGTGVTRLTNDPASDFAAAWSPDGSQIAFTRDIQIYKMNADGTNVTRLTDGTDPGLGLRPAWSPDGRKIVFERYGLGLWTMNADGTGQTQIPGTEPAFGPKSSPREPAWSPGGDKIAFSKYLGNEFSPVEIHAINPDGTDETRITHERGQPFFSSVDLGANWSPDGRKIAFHSPSTDAIYTINVDGTGETLIAQGPNGAQFPAGLAQPAWSPDETKIVFQKGEPTTSGDSDIYVMNPDGTGQTILFGSPARDSEPDWQPLLVNRPPDCSGVAASRPVLTTVNRRLVPVALDGATDPDGDPVTLSLDGVTQDEPALGSGDPTSPDAVDQGEGQLRVRAERDPHGDGRVYRIAFTASDGHGGSCSGTATVSVPRKKRKPAVDSAPPSYDSFGR
jgi:Tol biopolymer transport system component